VRVAVTGAAGYIGGWLLGELTARGHEVHATDLQPAPEAEPTWETWRAFNLGDIARHSWLRRYPPLDAVIHLAALYGRVWGEVDKVRTAGANAGLTAALAYDCAQLGIPLMYVSSSEVYGASADRGPVDPRSPLEPYNMYGLSKLWGEEAARLYAPDGLMITRLNMPYGPARWPPDPGEVPRTSGRPGPLGYNVLHSMTWQAEHGYDIKVHRGTTRCLTWVGDTVRGLAMILEAGQAGTWNVCRNDDHLYLGELASRVVAMTGSASRVIEEDPPERVTTHKFLKNDELLALGWEPLVAVDEGMKATWEYYRRFDRNGAWQG
jgi:nucleoside-diphosphate-sugar epimerase